VWKEQEQEEKQIEANEVGEEGERVGQGRGQQEVKMTGKGRSR
jgi:hypothetical protein